jgi:hypothetical protein
MTKPATVSRLSFLTTAIAAGIALTTNVGIANAKGNHHTSSDAESKPQFVISGQPANVKRVLPEKKKGNDKYAHKKKKGCEKIIVPTAECGVSRKDPVGNTHPTLPPTKTGGTTSPKGPSPTFTSVTLSNGVTDSAIFNGKGLTISSNSPGTITVSNGNSSVTLPGGSMTLHGATSVSASSDFQVVHRANGDVVVAVNPKPVKPSGNGEDVSLGGQLKGAAKDIGNGLENLGLGIISVGGPTPQPNTGTITQE